MSGQRWKLILVVAIVLVLGAAGWIYQTGRKPVATQSSTPWGADYFPNIPLVSQDGRELRFFDDLIKDKVVMINFIYTTCRDSCPLETARMRQVQKVLGDRVGKDVFMYSITIDPTNDTQAVLKKYSEQYHAGPGWLFLTGKEADITKLRKSLGMYREDNAADNFKDHDISLIIGNQKTGQWVKASAFENSQVLATRVGSWLSGWKLASNTKNDYSEAPALRNISRGESVFRTRCAACHTVGGGDVNDGVQGDVGPDLLGVTWNRDRAWLIRFLAEPDKMIEEKDPLALSLLAKYNNIPMPNLRLSEVDIEALIKYLEEESRSAEIRKQSAQQGQ